MATYRNNTTGEIQIHATNPGAGWTDLGAPVTTSFALENRVAWWRGLDLNTLASSWHPSNLQRDASGNPFGERAVARGVGGSGINILPRTLSIFDALPTVIKNSQTTIGLVTLAETASSALQMDAQGTGLNYVYFAASVTDYNIRLTKNRKWLCSFYVTGLASGDLVIALKTSDGAYSYFTITMAGNGWYSTVIDLTGNTSPRGFIGFQRTGVALFTIDRLMLEELIGDTLVPSAFSPGVG